MSTRATLCQLLAILLILPLLIEGAGESQRALCASNSDLCSLSQRVLLQVTSGTRKPRKGKNKPSTTKATSRRSPPSTESPSEKEDDPKPQEEEGSEPDRVVLVAITDEIEPPQDAAAIIATPPPGTLPSPTQGRPAGGGVNNRSQTTNTQLQAPGAFPESDDGVSLLDIISGRAGAPETEGDSQGDFDFPDGVTLELEGFTPLESLPPPGSGGPAGTQQGIPGDPAQGGVPGANIGPTNIQGGFQRGPPNIQGGFQRGPPNIQGGFQRGPPNIQGGLTNIQGGIRGNNTGVQTGPTFVGEQQPGSLPGPVSGAPGGVGTLPSGPEPQGGAPTGKRPNITAEIIEAPPEGEDAEFFGHVNADLCPCSDAVPSGAFNCMQVRFQEECDLQSILKGPADVPEGFCEVTCGRCDCCTDMLTMSSRRGLDTFRKIFQTMADAEGSRSIARSLQNPSFATTVFAPTNDAFSRMLHLLNMTVDDFLEQPSLMNQVMTYHVLLGPTATSSEELSTGFLGTTLPTVNSAAFVSLNTSGPILGVDGIGSYANVLVPDVFSCKSIFHVVDEVLLPFSPKGFQGR